MSEVERLVSNRLYDAALNALDGVGVLTPRETALKAAVLAGLEQYTEALDAVNGVDAGEAGIDVAEFRDIVGRLQRESEGNFEFEDVYGSALRARAAGTDPAAAASPTAGLLPSFASYVGPVEVTMSANGRGLIATRDIQGGEVLFCGPPLLVVPSAPSRGGPDPFAEKLRDACRVSPHTKRVVSTLLSNGSGALESVKFNDFRWAHDGAPKGELSDDILQGVAKTNCFEDNGYMVLYPSISLTNHSCCPNATKVPVGFSLFVRATRTIKAGEEVCISYFDVLRPLKEREVLTKNWAFRCECPRCTYERTLPEELQVGGTSAQRIEDVIKDPESTIDIAGREVQWLRAGHVQAYKAELEPVFPWGDEAAFQRGRLLRALETTDPASFTHVKIAYLDWLVKRTTPGSGGEAAMKQAMNYCALVHKVRYGPIPPDQMVPLLQCTQAAAQSTGVGEEFCSATGPPSAPAEHAGPVAEPAGPPGLTLLD